MAIGKISGPMLQSNLDRQGIDLQFSTNSQPLVYMDFAQLRMGVNTSSLSETLTVNGNLSTSNIIINGSTISAKSGNLSIGSPVNLGSIGDVHITGGSANYLITTDGAGNLSFIDANAQPGISALEANVGAYQLWANANIGSYQQWSNANVGAYQLWANANLATQTTNYNILYANVGAYETYANANAATQASYINTINANVSAANSAIATLRTQVYSNANVTSYLTVFNGNINAGNIGVSGNLYTDYIGSNVNSVVTFAGTTAIKLPTGNDAQRPTGAVGDFRFNTQSGAPEYYTGTAWVPITNTVTDQQIVPDGANVTYTLSQTATNVSVLVSINGTLQMPDTGSAVEGSYTVSDNKITFKEAPLTTDIIDIRFLGGIVSMNNVLSDDLTISGNLTLSGILSAPLTTKANNSTGTAGQICWDGSYIYVCTATNTWKRVTLNSF